MRILYLTQGATVLSGREAFGGRTLFDRLAEHAGEAIVAHAVVAAGEEGDISLELLDKDVMTARSYLAFDPHVIYFEGGLLGGLGPWRAPRALLEQSVRSGAVVIVADAEFNELNQDREEYISAWDFLRARPNFGRDDDSPVYGIDRTTQEREFDLDPHRMVVSNWLRPVYQGVDRILAVSPIELSG